MPGPAIRIQPLTPELWPALESLFGKQGACWGCWCMYWRLPRKQWEAMKGDGTKRLFKSRVKQGPPPGVLAFIGEEAVGWLQIGPRADAPQWNTPRRLSAPLEPSDAADAGVWAASCFFVKTAARGQGVTSALLDGGLDYARKSGARIVEACPIEREGRIDPATAYVGHAAVFKRAGFREIARRKETRPLVRLVLAAKGRAVAKRRSTR